MVQTRPRSSQESSPALTAATLRMQMPQDLPERSLERSSSARSPSECSSDSSSERSSTRLDALPRRNGNERQASRSARVSQTTVPERPPSESAEQLVPVGVSTVAAASTEHGDAMGVRDSTLDGANSEGKEGATRETMVYEGSVRSGQQVGRTRGRLVPPRLVSAVLSRHVSPRFVV